MRQKRILLRLVEAVNLVAEQDRAALDQAQAAFGFLDDLAHARDAFGDGAELHECGAGALRDDASEGGFAGAGRPPEDDAAQLVLLDQLAQRLAGTQQMILADELLERGGTHACGERRIRVCRRCRIQPFGCTVLIE